MSTSEISGTITTGVRLSGKATYADPLTFTSTALITNDDGDTAVTADDARTIQNDGHISGATLGIDLLLGGSVTNTIDGTIYGHDGGIIAEDNVGGVPTTIVNAGTIAASRDESSTVHNYGIVLGFGGSITNTADGYIGGLSGIHALEAATIINDGQIVGDDLAICMEGGGSVTNQSAGTISGGSDDGLCLRENTTVDNSGTIQGAFGIEMESGGTLINRTGGVVSGTYAGLRTGGGGTTVDNSGTITGTGATFGTISLGVGIQLGDEGSVINRTGGLISGYNAGILAYDPGTTIDNFGTIKGTGTVGNGHTVGYGIDLETGGTITNEAAGTISGVYAGVGLKDGGTLINAGVITGGVGVYLTEGGSVTNAGIGTISGAYSGVFLNDGGTLTNSGTVIGTGGASDGVFILNGGSVDNTGVIHGASYGIYLANGGTIFNEAGGKITGSEGIKVGVGTTTIENAGTITGLTGGDAIEMNGATNRLIVDAGAVFNGNVVAKDGSSNTLELHAGATPGTLTGLGSQFLGFQTITIDNGGTWTVAGAIDGFDTPAGQGPVIGGFDGNDRLDLTNLTYDASDIFSLDTSGPTETLTIKTSGGTVLATIHLSGDYAGHFFHLADDDHGGTYVSEVACYCRGTLIETEQGQIPVEDLKIGDRLVTASGEAKPIRWIGRRAYSGRFANRNLNVLPICFKANSIAWGVPKRDLWISPEHAMFFEGILIPARWLVNGDTVIRARRVDQLEYFHIELEQHDVIVAEGALSETFVDDGSRDMFHNAAEFRDLYPDERPEAVTRYCAPRLDEGFEVERVRDLLAAQALRVTPWAQRRKNATAA